MTRWACAVLGFVCGAGAVRADVSRLPDAVPDRGGVTFDFAAASAARFAAAFDPAANLLGETFSGTTSNRTVRMVRYPKGWGRRYRVSGYYKLHQESAGRSVILVKSGTYGEDGEFVPRPTAQREVLLIDRADDWIPFSARISAKEGVRDGAQIEFIVRGRGRLDFKDVNLTPDGCDDAIELKLMPLGNVDSSFAVSEGQCGFMNWYWRKNLDRKFELGELEFRMSLPPGIRFVAAAAADPKTVRTTSAADGSTVTSFRLRKPYPPFGWAFNTHDAFRVLVRATRAPGTCGTGSLVITHDGGAFPEIRSSPVRFLVIPKIRTAAPSRYMNGIMTDWCFGYADPAAEKELSRLFADCGVRWIVNKAQQTKHLYPLWRKLGVRRITPETWNAQDGYAIGDAARRPACDRYVTDTDDPARREKLSRAACPHSLYAESDFFRTNTVPLLWEMAAGSDGLWANWEPSMFTARGCFCEKCREDFIAWSRLPRAEVERDWPANVKPKGRYAHEGEEFRGTQMARVVWTLDKHVRAATGPDSVGFIPGVCWIEMGSWWRPNRWAKEMEPIRYADRLKWIDPWGPYVAWESNDPWAEQKRKPLVHFFAAKDVRETVDRDYPPGKRPNLMAIPQGYQCGNWLAQPEWIGMALDSYFFHGFGSTVEYYFPCGYDARYWRAFAAANGRAAKYERFVWDGTPADAKVSVKTAREYAAPVKHVSGYLPKENARSTLQVKAFDLGGARIVAAFNFWEKGEAFFNLKLEGLDGAYRIVSEDGMLRARSREETAWSGRTLAEKGVYLTVGAARCTVFEIRPAKDPDGTAAKSILTDAAYRRLFESRREELRKEAERDAERERINDALYPDWMPVI